jgi:hypothetical protein
MTAPLFALLLALQPPGGPPRPRFELGRVLPPPVRDELKLTEEQAKKLAALEAEVKAALENILTKDQLASLPKNGGPATPAPASAEATLPAGIQWFAQWDAAKAEAVRTGKPILLVSAAPHCSGVSGIW